MERLVTNTLQLFHSLIRTYVKSGDYVLDATAGNGYDTMLLADQVGKDGLVYTMDLQQSAIDNTKKRLMEAGLLDRAQLYCMDHAEIDNLGLTDLSLVIFNLGYLPGSPKEIVTRGESTIQAVEASLRALGTLGLILITVYPGSESGWQEHSILEEYWKTLDQHDYDVMELKFPNRRNVSPYGVMIQKLR